MTLASVLIPPAVTVPAAVLVAAWAAWYWRRLGRDDVPRSRRYIRRTSTAVMLAGLPVVVAASSFIDAVIQPGAWAVSWILVMAALGIVVVASVADILNTTRLVRQERLEQLIREAADLARRSRGGGK